MELTPESTNENHATIRLNEKPDCEIVGVVVGAINTTPPGEETRGDESPREHQLGAIAVDRPEKGGKIRRRKARESRQAKATRAFAVPRPSEAEMTIKTGQRDCVRNAIQRGRKCR